MLTAEALADILRALRADAARPSDKIGGRRRRSAPRVGVRLQISILPLDGQLPASQARVLVRVRDLSPTGLGFVHREPLAKGQPFVIRLPKAIGGIARLLGRVEHCRRIDGGQYQIGATVLLNAPRAEVEALLARAA